MNGASRLLLACLYIYITYMILNFIFWENIDTRLYLAYNLQLISLGGNSICSLIKIQFNVEN